MNAAHSNSAVSISLAQFAPPSMRRSQSQPRGAGLSGGSLFGYWGDGVRMRASGKGQRRVADMTHGLDVDHQVVALRRLAKVPLAELSEAMVQRALLMAADMIGSPPKWQLPPGRRSRNAGGDRYPRHRISGAIGRGGCCRRSAVPFTPASSGGRPCRQAAAARYHVERRGRHGIPHRGGGGSPRPTVCRLRGHHRSRASGAAPGRACQPASGWNA
jgi:hypothetical protein